MPRVLRIVNRFNLGGPTYNAAYLTRYLSPEFKTRLIGGEKDDSEESSEFILKNMDLPYSIVPHMKRSIRPLDDFLAFREIKKIISDFKPDIVHTHAAKAGALGRRAAFACGVPVTLHTFHGHVFHSYFGPVKTSIYKTIERNLARKTSAIIAISEKQKEELVQVHRIAPAEKVHVIPLGFDLARFRERTEEKRAAFRKKYNLADDEIAIGIVGRLVPVKNHLLFLKALGYVKEKSQRKIRGFIVGDGEERNSLEQAAGKLGLQNHVVFTSWEKEPDKVYPGLDIVCLTSFNEGTPVSLIEAQAAGKPIVATNVGGIENVVAQGKTGLLCDSSDEETYSAHLLRLTDHPELRKAFGREGWDLVRNKFSYTRLASETKRLYNKLLG